MQGQPTADSNDGLNTSDILELPRLQREIMLALMRDASGSADGLTVDDIARKVGASADLDTALDALVQAAYLLASGDGETRRFRPNLGRKRVLTRSRLMDSVLGELEDTPPPATKSKPRIDLFKRLD